MTKDNYIERIRNIVDNHHTQYGKFLRFPENKELLDFIESYESEKLKDNNIQTKIYWILNGLHDFPRCHNPSCQKPITFNVRNLFTGYGTSYPTCCSSCAKKTPEYLKNYGDSIERRFGEGCRHPMHSQEVKDKVVETNLERYGAKFYLLTDEGKERRIQTCIEKYGGRCPCGFHFYLQKTKLW